VCGKETELEADHVRPISTDPLSCIGPENLQLLCSECHVDKPMAQSFQTQYNPLLSGFNEHTWKHLVMSPRPQQQVYRSSKVDDKAACQNIDAIRCRRNMLTHSCYPWYVSASGMTLCQGLSLSALTLTM